MHLQETAEEGAKMGCRFPAEVCKGFFVWQGIAVGRGTTVGTSTQVMGPLEM